MNIKEQPQEAFIKIDYTNKVKAKYLSRYLSSLSEEYKYFIKENNMEDSFSDELYIKEIEKGSIEIFLSPEYLAGVLPIISDINTIYEFITYVGNFLNYFKKDDEKIDLPASRIKNYKNLNGVINDGNISSVNYIDNRGGTLNILNSYGKEDSKVIEKNIQKHLLENEDIKEGEFKSVAFYWDYAKFKDTNRYNYKGICEKISQKPFNVIFENDEIKDYMTAESHLDKPWQDLIYVVDIEYTTVKGKGQIKILKVYTDQTYFQSKDE